MYGEHSRTPKRNIPRNFSIVFRAIIIVFSQEKGNFALYTKEKR